MKVKTRLTWSQWLTITGIVIAVANMCLAWTVLLVMPSSEADVSRIFSSSGQDLSPMKDTGAADDVFDFQLVSSIAHWALSKAQLDLQELVLVLGLAFTLMAIGFSFFVMGVESAVSVKGESRDFGWIVVKATSPGWLAILFSALLMALTVYSRSDLPIDPKTAAQARLIQAQAEARLNEAEAQEMLTRAKADAEDTTSWAKERVLNAKADLIEAKAAAAGSGDTQVNSRKKPEPPEE